ncbi:OLC1v1031359C1 [Oldenlandia corymbosa var. corymbosa]|uniref:OLC1v1031359C1 n=1 Tax=Oldenlandia corymbosa var. corymbosa TaxID=529605 RepID=A0AAV1CIP5_OLDCO|nr:OLC1v1031359C1 [Oldenlandia corymbosa var. corymbosa]
MAESFAMNGGDGMYSYTKNSEYQKEGSNAVHELIKEAISKSFDTKLIASISNNRFCLADLGCSVGPNTFFNMETILEAIKNKHNNNNNINVGRTCDTTKLEFQVLFNDHVSNDFNTLFANIPPEKEYFAAGVPGSFYDQLFPCSSIHFAYSSYSLPWLSKVPEELLDRYSPAWSGTKFQSMGASPEVCISYASQFKQGMKNFLDARAKEIVPGGMMAIITPGVPDGIDSSDIFSAILFSFVESSLVDMVNEVMISEMFNYSVSLLHKIHL